MHHITYTDYYGREQLVKIPADQREQQESCLVSSAILESLLSMSSGTSV